MGHWCVSWCAGLALAGEETGSSLRCVVLQAPAVCSEVPQMVDLGVPHVLWYVGGGPVCRSQGSRLLEDPVLRRQLSANSAGSRTTTGIHYRVRTGALEVPEVSLPRVPSAKSPTIAFAVGLLMWGWPGRLGADVALVFCCCPPRAPISGPPPPCCAVGMCPGVAGPSRLRGISVGYPQVASPSPPWPRRCPCGITALANVPWQGPWNSADLCNWGGWGGVVPAHTPLLRAVWGGWSTARTRAKHILWALSWLCHMPWNALVGAIALVALCRWPKRR